MTNLLGLVCIAGLVHLGLCQFCPWAGRGKQGMHALRSQIKAVDFVPGTKIQFKCQKGQQLVNREPLVCQSNGQWKGDWLGCKPGSPKDEKPGCKKSCQPPAVPENGYMARPAIPLESYHHRLAVEFGCNQGLYMNGVSRIICQDGAWSDPSPTCQETKPSVSNVCPLLAYGIEHLSTDVTVTPAAYKKTSSPNFLIGTKIRFSCSHGMRLQGRRQMTCLKSGKWSAHTPSCVPRDPRTACPAPPKAPANAFLVGGEKNVTKFAFIPGSYVKYSCQPGYLRIGYDRVFCKRDGVWSSDNALMRCTLKTTTTPPTTTTPKACPPLENPQGRSGRSVLKMKLVHGSARSRMSAKGANKPRTGDQYQFECPPTYRMTGEKRMVCMNGRWIGEMPGCEEIPTTTPAPTCSSIQDVITKAGPRNGNLKVQKAQSRRGRSVAEGEHGSTYNFMCPTEFDLIGDRRMTCVDGQWLGDVPDCILRPTTPDPCSFIPPPGPNMILADRFNKTAIYACQRGYEMKGPSTARCSGGKWAFTKKGKPKCVKRKPQCQPPPQPPGDNDKRSEVSASMDVWFCMAVDFKVGADISTGAGEDEDGEPRKKTRVSASAFAKAFASVEAKRADEGK